MKEKIPNLVIRDGKTFVTREYKCVKCKYPFISIHLDIHYKNTVCNDCGSPVIELVDKYFDCPYCGKYGSIELSNKHKKYCHNCRAEVGFLQYANNRNNPK